MASIPRIAAITAVCASLFLFCAGAATVQHRARAATAFASRNRPAASDGAIVLIDDWEQVPAGGDSDAPSDSGSADAAAGEPAAVANHPQRGPASAPVTIIEYSDFQCPYCRKAEPTMKQIRADYGPKVRVVYMDFPLGFHPNAMDAALAARCAGEQGQFWAYHDALLSGASGLSKPALKQLAQGLHLDAASFNSCLDRRKYAGAIESDIAEGRRFGVSGTPSFVINGRTVFGALPLPEFEKIVDAGLAASARK